MLFAYGEGTFNLKTETLQLLSAEPLGTILLARGKGGLKTGQDGEPESNFSRVVNGLDDGFTSASSVAGLIGTELPKWTPATHYAIKAIQDGIDFVEDQSGGYNFRYLPPQSASAYGHKQMGQFDVYIFEEVELQVQMHVDGSIVGGLFGFQTTQWARILVAGKNTVNVAFTWEETPPEGFEEPFNPEPTGFVDPADIPWGTPAQPQGDGEGFEDFVGDADLPDGIGDDPSSTDGELPNPLPASS